MWGRVAGVGVLLLVLSGCSAEPPESLKSVTAAARDAGWEGEVIFDDTVAANAELRKTYDELGLHVTSEPAASCAELQDHGKKLATVRLKGGDGQFYPRFADDVLRLGQVCELAGGASPYNDSYELWLQAEEQLSDAR